MPLRLRLTGHSSHHRHSAHVDWYQLRKRSAPSGGPLWRLSEAIADFGAVVIRWVEGLGDITLFAWSTMLWLFTRLPRRDTLLTSIYNIGVLSLPVVALTGTFIGMVLAVQSYTQFREFGLETQLGGVINMSMFRELGPVLAATMLAGRVGSAMAAELGTMRVTEQIDALVEHGRQPDSIPRRAAVPGLPVHDSRRSRSWPTSWASSAAGVYSMHFLGIDSHHYWNNSQQFVENWDLFYGIFKSVFFGATIAVVSCYRGFHCQPGAEGVGRAATAAFVYSFVVILILDLLLSIVLDQIYLTIWPVAPTLFGV